MSGKLEKASGQFEDDVARLISRNKNGSFTSLIETCESQIVEQKACIKQAVRDWLPLAENVPREAAVDEDVFLKGADVRSQMETHQTGIITMKGRILEAMRQALKGA
jgi:hypothetical protein